MSAEDDDELRELARRMKGEDPDAFAALYRRTCDDVYRIAALLIGRESEAADIVHDVYIELPAALRRYDDARAFRPWLNGIVARQVRLWRRRRWRRQRLADRLRTLTAGAARGQGTGFAAPADHTAAGPLDLADAVQTLPPKSREVVILRYYCDCSLDEIAAALGIPLGTVKSRLHAALRTLRTQFEPRAESEEPGPWISNRS